MPCHTFVVCHHYRHPAHTPQRRPLAQPCTPRWDPCRATPLRFMLSWVILLLNVCVVVSDEEMHATCIVWKGREGMYNENTFPLSKKWKKKNNGNMIMLLYNNGIIFPLCSCFTLRVHKKNKILLYTIYNKIVFPLLFFVHPHIGIGKTISLCFCLRGNFEIQLKGTQVGG